MWTGADTLPLVSYEPPQPRDEPGPGPWPPHPAAPPAREPFPPSPPYQPALAAPPPQPNQWSGPPGQHVYWPPNQPPPQQQQPPQQPPVPSGPPASGPPASGPPASGPPTSGAPDPGWRDWQDNEQPWQPRITPQPAPTRSRLLLGLLIGLLVGALLAGVGGYFVGAATADGTVTADPTTSTAPSGQALPPYEASQLALNKAKFDGDLAPLAEPWLARMGGCVTDTETGGPKLQPDEKKHVFCRYGSVSIHFALYGTKPGRDNNRSYRQQLATTASDLAPGLQEPAQKPGGVSGAPGSYVEYAFRDSEGRALCGLWWDRDEGLAAMFIETLCEAGIGGNWDALRDLWQRHS